MSPLPLELYILTFNCGRALIDPFQFAPHVFQGLPADGRLPDLVMFSLQEVAPIAQSFLGGSYLTPYYDQVSASLNIAAKKRGDGAVRYRQRLVRNVGMTVMMLFVREELVERIRWMQVAGTGVGYLEMGNKGAVGVRLGYTVEDGQAGEVVEVTLIAAHLAPMEGAVERRNEDWMNIARRLVFCNEPDASRRPRTGSASDDTQPLLGEDGMDVLPQDQTLLYDTKGHVFFAGDLNYRTSKIPPREDSHLTFPQPNNDPTDAQHVAQWFKNDQLTEELGAGRTLHGFAEAEINFPPTYKYDPSKLAANRPRLEYDGDGNPPEPERWTWAKHRFPSWCDRILFLPSASLSPRVYTALPLQSTSDHRPVALSVAVDLAAPVLEGHDVRREVPVEVDPTWRSRRAAARRLEVVVGVLAYLAYTQEGKAVLMGLAAGAAGGYLLVRSLVS